MNGELYQICCLALAAKKALKEGSTISYVPDKYIKRIEFQFLPEKKLFHESAPKADNVGSWFEQCLKRGLQDVMLYVPVSVKDRNLLGFSNMSRSLLVCFFKNRSPGCFTPRWEFDSAQKVWYVLYTEYEWKDLPKDKPRFTDNSNDFKAVLTEIEKLARMIACDGFAGIFQKAFSVLEGDRDTIKNPVLPQIPEKNRRLFEAACIADVFGGMGSWNDSPPYMAHEKGLDNEYERLSGELLTQIRLAILYAVNEW